MELLDLRITALRAQMTLEPSPLSGKGFVLQRNKLFGFLPFCFPVCRGPCARCNEWLTVTPGVSKYDPVWRDSNVYFNMSILKPTYGLLYCGSKCENQVFW